MKLISDKKEYLDSGLHVGDTGIILEGKRNGYWLVYFDGEIFIENGVYQTTEIDAGVLEEDLEVIFPYQEEQSGSTEKSSV